jgi:hypothetical protein
MSTPSESSLPLWCGLVSESSHPADRREDDLDGFWIGTEERRPQHETNVSAGPNTKVMRKAKMSFQSGQVKQVIRTYAVEIQTSDKKELDASAVEMKLRKAMGANCKTDSTISCQMLIDVKTTARSRPTKQARQQFLRQQIDHYVDRGCAYLSRRTGVLPIDSTNQAENTISIYFLNSTIHLRKIHRSLSIRSVCCERMIVALQFSVVYGFDLSDLSTGPQIS